MRRVHAGTRYLTDSESGELRVTILCQLRRKRTLPRGIVSANE